MSSFSPQTGSEALGLNKEDWGAILRGLAQRKYHLLLGAGASRDALDRHGHRLPLSNELALQLVDQFQIGAHGDITLSRAYERAKRRRSKDGATVAQYFGERFTECQPPAWYETACKIQWAQIWTLNVDDVIERAYDIYDNKHTSGRHQTPVSLTWTDPYRGTEQFTQQVIVLHLHGKAQSNPSNDIPQDFVFDIVEYFHASRHEHSWHHIFDDQYRTEPFIIVGTRLVGEYDLAGILRQRNRARELTGTPSVLVTTSLDEYDSEELAEWGL